MFNFGQTIKKMVNKTILVMEKVVRPFETIGGWIATAFVFFLSFLGDGANLLLAVLAVTLIDAVFGVWSSLKRGRFFESRRLRDTAIKLLIYSGLQIATILLDKVVTTELLCMRATTALIVVCEIWSSLASVTIIYPNFVVGKLMKKYLTGEIANKLGIDKDDIDNILNKEEKKNEGDNKGDIEGGREQ